MIILKEVERKFMKTKYKIISIFLLTLLIFPVFSMSIGASSESDENMLQPCPHNTLYNFDEENKTLNGVYEGNRVEALLSDIAFVGEKLLFYTTGNEQ